MGGDIWHSTGDKDLTKNQLFAIRCLRTFYIIIIQIRLHLREQHQRRYQKFAEFIKEDIKIIVIIKKIIYLLMVHKHRNKKITVVTVDTDTEMMGLMEMDSEAAVDITTRVADVAMEDTTANNEH